VSPGTDPTLSPNPLRRLLSHAVAYYLNQLSQRGGIAVEDAALQLHRRLAVADLHADCLLWGRDLLKRSRIGHVDLPRLIEGGVALQVFSVVTHAPRGINIEKNDAAGDNVTLLAAVQDWPAKARHSLLQRALYQAERLRQLERRADGRLKIVHGKHDLRDVLDRHRERPLVGALLSLEGAHALEGNLDNLDALFDAGFRMIAPTHFIDTDVGGSAHGTRKGGLSELGRAWVARMERMRIAIDLAHASAPTIDDVLAIATRPVIVSHTGVRGTCDNARNVSDDQLRRVAATGGVIGIGFWGTATGGNDVAAIVRAIRHATNVAGADHVALGSDWDGAVNTAIDAAQLPQLTAALMRARFGENEIEKIMGGNVMRVLSTLLPE